MTAAFKLFVSLPRAVGCRINPEIVMVPLEVEVYWFDGALHVVRAWVTEFVRLENGFMIYRAGERHNVSGPDDLEALEKECARMDAERNEYTPETDPAEWGELENVTEFVQQSALEDFDQRPQRRAA